MSYRYRYDLRNGRGRGGEKERSERGGINGDEATGDWERLCDVGKGLHRLAGTDDNRCLLSITCSEGDNRVTLHQGQTLLCSLHRKSLDSSRCNLTHHVLWRQDGGAKNSTAIEMES